MQSSTKDHAADETRRGQTETQIIALGSSIESLQKRMNEMNAPDVNVLAKSGAKFTAKTYRKFC